MRVIDVLNRVTTLYNDKEYVRVDERHYLKFLDDALSQLVLSRPESHVATRIVQLVQGTRQELPEEGYTLIEIYMNKKEVVDPVTGEISFDNYYPIGQVKREDLDYFYNWQSATNSMASKDYINEFAYDPRSPRVFWVNPYVGNIPVYIQMDYSYGFDKFGELTDDIEDIEQMVIPALDDKYIGPIVSYMLYLLYSTDSTSVVDREVASRYETSFYQQLSIDVSGANIVIPKTENAEVTAAIRQAS